MKQQRYYLDMATCVNCHKIYPVSESNNKILCLVCKADAQNWPMKEV